MHLLLLFLSLIHASATDIDPYAHHIVKKYYRDPSSDLALVETANSLGVRLFTDTSHCANLARGKEGHKMKKRYDLRADPEKPTSDPALEGTLRSRCVPIVTTAGNTEFTDQCLKEDDDKKHEDCKTINKCHVTVGDCPTRGDSTKKAPHWSHSGHNYKIPALIKYYANGKEGTAKCLKVEVEDKKGDKKGHLKAVPYLVPCPERDVDFGDEFKWYLEPRIGTFVSKANGMCLTLKSTTKNILKKEPDLSQIHNNKLNYQLTILIKLATASQSTMDKYGIGATIVYHGQMEGGIPNGFGNLQGEYEGEPPSEYSGQWVNGKKNGYGKESVTGKNYNIYFGQWKNGYKHGTGRITESTFATVSIQSEESVHRSLFQT